MSHDVICGANIVFYPKSAFNLLLHHYLPYNTATKSIIAQLVRSYPQKY